MYFDVDLRCKEYFKGLKQVFLYLTDECNLRCSYCLYKPDLTFQLREKEIPVRTAINVISDFREMGASKLTIIGGEPTLYGASNSWRPLLDLISASKDLGYEYVRIDTNGSFEESLLHKKEFRMLDEITFSLDSDSSEITDLLRGERVFDRCVGNMKAAVQLGYRVDITCCAHKENIGRDNKGALILHRLILFAESLGVYRINFHPLFKMGVPRDTWIGDADIQPDEWLRVHDEIKQNLEDGLYKIIVRIPQRFITKEEFANQPEYYGYCPVKMGERVLIHPNGVLRVCALMIGTPYGVARLFGNQISWDETSTNETRNHKLGENTPCANQRKDFGDLLPLCISFKAKQDEIIWKEKLRWESRRKETS
ncbi:MAG: radical SAM protein [Promethearchaeota archaeon]